MNKAGFFHEEQIVDSLKALRQKLFNALRNSTSEKVSLLF